MQTHISVPVEVPVAGDGCMMLPPAANMLSTCWSVAPPDNTPSAVKTRNQPIGDEQASTHNGTSPITSSDTATTHWNATEVRFPPRLALRCSTGPRRQGTIWYLRCREPIHCAFNTKWAFQSLKNFETLLF